LNCSAGEQPTLPYPGQLAPGLGVFLLLSAHFSCLLALVAMTPALADKHHIGTIFVKPAP